MGGQDIFVWWNCEPDMDLEARSGAVLVTRCDHANTGTGDVVIVFFKLPDLMFDRATNSIRGFASFEGQFQGDLHNVLSTSKNAVSIVCTFQQSITPV